MSGGSGQQLAEIAARAEAATAGPWGSHRDLDGVYTVQARPRITPAEGSTTDGVVARITTPDDGQAYADARFIAHAPTDVRALLARIAELEAERHSTNEALSDAAEAIREKDARLAAVRDAVAEAFMCPDEDCGGHLPKLEQILGGLDLLRDTEAGGLRG